MNSRAGTTVAPICDSWATSLKEELTSSRGGIGFVTIITRIISSPAGNNGMRNGATGCRPLYCMQSRLGQCWKQFCFALDYFFVTVNYGGFCFTRPTAGYYFQSGQM